MQNVIIAFPYIASGVTILLGIFAIYSTICIGLGYPVPLLTQGLIRVACNREKSIAFLREDILNSSQSIIIFSKTSADWLWDLMIEEMERKAEKGVQFSFFISKAEFDPDEDKTLISFAEKFPNTVKVLKLSLYPPVDLRLIDEQCVHISACGIDQGNIFKPCWRHKGRVAPPYILGFANDLVRQYHQNCF